VKISSCAGSKSIRGPIPAGADLSIKADAHLAVRHPGLVVPIQEAASGEREAAPESGRAERSAVFAIGLKIAR